MHPADGNGNGQAARAADLVLSRFRAIGLAALFLITNTGIAVGLYYRTVARIESTEMNAKQLADAIAQIAQTQKRFGQFIEDTTKDRRAIGAIERERVRLCNEKAFRDAMKCVNLPSEAQLQALER